MHPSRWPVLKHYDQRHLDRIALPIGGIGTGTVSLGGFGDLRDWELMNRPAKGFVPVMDGVGPFVCVAVKLDGSEAKGRVAEGPIPLYRYEGREGCEAPQHGFPRFRSARFSTAYPFATVDLEDPDFPVQVQLQAFNPLIPGRVEDSAQPVAVLRYTVSNPGPQAARVSVCATVPNFIGVDGSELSAPAPNWTRSYLGAKDNRNGWRKGGAVQGIFMSSDGVDSSSEAWGTMALTCAADLDASFRTDWPAQPWGYRKRKFWEELLEGGRLTDAGGKNQAPVASLAIHRDIPAGDAAHFEFYLTWHFPNRPAWGESPQLRNAPIVGNAYTQRFADAWDAAEQIVPRLPRLEADTLRFVEAFCRSNLPPEILEAALFNLSTLRSQTCFQTPDGHFFGWEGCHDHMGSCRGNCTHVWNYEHTTPLLFGSLARSARELEFVHATNDQGHMPFRIPLPIAQLEDKSKRFWLAAADGQMGCLMKLYREWQLSGDDEWLRRLWSHARRALEFCWIPGGWDADQDGVMEGCQHNTMDVEYYGPNPQMAFWYLGALLASERMARHLGEVGFAQRCAELRERGSAWIEEHLFNGEYYIHQVKPPMTAESIAEGLRAHMGTEDLANPDLQLADGCLIDQLVGQCMAHAMGLGYIGKPERMRKTLENILRYNHRKDFWGHFNHMRSYTLGDESALLMASYPHGRPERPFPYYSEVMTGFEYAAAIHMLYEGMVDEGLDCIRAIRSRYDGARRSPFNEAECGHHYARAMAAWGAVLALTGFQYSAVDRAMSFACAPGRYFWSTGWAWGETIIADASIQMLVHHGKLALDRLGVNGQPAELGAGIALDEGESGSYLLQH